MTAPRQAIDIVEFTDAVARNDYYLFMRKVGLVVLRNDPHGLDERALPEDILALPDGTLRVTVRLPNVGAMSRDFPPGSWRWAAEAVN